ncbi:MAG: peptidoglycan-binding protein [bacterium]|nr:peptidoglycan-binding protein [bacterium]
MNTYIQILSGRNILQIAHKAFSAFVIFTFAFYPFAFTGFVPVAYAAAGVNIDTINGEAPQSDECIESPVIAGISGTTGSQGGHYSIDIDWGDGSSIESIQLGDGGPIGKDKPFSIFVSHTFLITSNSISVFLYHGQPGGRDASDLVLQDIEGVCITPPDAPENPTIQIKKVIVIDDELTPAEDQSGAEGWDFDIDGDEPSSAGPTDGNGETEVVDVNPDTYDISETPQDGFVLVYAVCKDDDGEVGEFYEPENGVISVTAVSDQTIVCTFYNAPLGSITVEKVTEPESDDTEFDFSITGFEDFVLIGGISEFFGNLFPGAYTIEEDFNEDYEASVECTNGESGFSLVSFLLGYGEDVTCTFTNTFIDEDPSADLEISKSVSPNPVVEGGEVTYTIVVTNNGPDTATNVVVTDNLEECLIFEEASASQGIYDPDTGEWTVGDLEDGESATLEITVTVDCEFGDVDNVATATSDVNDPDEDNEETDNSSSVSLTVEEEEITPDPAILTIVKLTEGGDGTFEFTISDNENVTIETSEGEGSVEVELSEGSYAVQEIVPNGWILDDFYCEYYDESIGESIENGQFIFVEDGDHVTCYFENTKDEQTQIDPPSLDDPEDVTPPVSTFNNERGHEIIDTEIVSLELRGQSTDDVGPEGDPQSGVASAEMQMFQLGGPEMVSSPNFNEIFDSLSCEELSSEQVPIEIVALSLTSVSPLTVSWNHDWSIPSLGVYCVLVHATDNAGNIEHTGVAGPFAYDPPASESPPPPPPPPSSGGGTGGGGTDNFQLGTTGGNLNPPPSNTGGEVLGESTGPEEEVLGETCELLINSYIKSGAENNVGDVQKLQEFLNEHLGVNLPITGFYGALTEAAVNQFQLKYGDDVLAPWIPFGHPDTNTPTGYVYKTTKWKINNIVCPGSEPFPTLP